MTLNILAFYMFYQFVVISEKNQTTIDLPWDWSSLSLDK
jgi:hypothetical protein